METNVLREVRRFSGCDNTGDRGSNHGADNISQITTALLMVFIIAAFISTANSTTAVNEAQKQATAWIKKYQDVANTPAGVAQRKLEESIIDNQRQKFINAIDVIDREYRASTGLSVFSGPGPHGALEFFMDTVFSSGKLVDKRFNESCKFSSENLANQESLQERWLKLAKDKVESMRKDKVKSMRKNSEDANDPTKSEEVLTPENKDWVFRYIITKVRSLHADTRSLQRAALAVMINYYYENPSELKGSDVYKSVKTFSTATAEQQMIMVSQIRDELYVFVKSVFAKQGVPLLSDV